MIFLNKTKFRPALFIGASLSAFFLFFLLYFLLFANAYYFEISPASGNNQISETSQPEDSACVNRSDFDTSDPYITKTPNWKGR